MSSALHENPQAIKAPMAALRFPRATSAAWIITVLCLGTLYTLSLGGTQIRPAFGDGPSIYIVSALSLARGAGYRMINYPTVPYAQFYPIGYPFILSAVFRSIPFGPSSIFTAQLVNVFAALVWLEASRRYLSKVVPPRLAVCGAAAIGLAPLTLEMVGQIKADIVFGAILMSTMVVADTGRRSEEELTRRPTRDLLLGALAAAAMLVRTIGFTLIIGIAAQKLLRRDWKGFLRFAAGSAVLMVPWIAWSIGHRGGTFHSYFAENDITWRTPLSNFWQLASNTSSSLLFAPFAASTWHTNPLLSKFNWILILIGLSLTSLVGFGWLKLFGRLHPVAPVLACYMLIVFFWWFEPTRFIIPVLPLLVVCGVIGIRSIRFSKSIINRKTALAAAGCCIVGAAFVDVVKITHVWRYGNADGPQAAQEWKQTSTGLEWIEQNTPKDAVVFSSYPAGVWLFTSRNTLDLNNVSHIDANYVPLGGMNLDAQFQKAGQFKAAYVFATYRWDFIKKFEWGMEPVQKYIASNPGRLELQWSSEDGKNAIYRLASAPGESNEHK
jgi:hypothetical protein